MVFSPIKALACSGAPVFRYDVWLQRFPFSPSSGVRYLKILLHGDFLGLISQGCLDQ